MRTTGQKLHRGGAAAKMAPSALSAFLRRNLVPVIVFVLWVVLLFFVHPISTIHDGYLLHTNEERADAALPVYQAHALDQTFSIQGSANQLEIACLSGRDLSNLTYEISILDAQGNILASWDQDSAKVSTPDNRIVARLDTPLAPNTSDNPFYLLHIANNADAGYMLPLLTMSVDDFGESSTVRDATQLSLSYDGQTTDTRVLCLSLSDEIINLPAWLALWGGLAAFAAWLLLYRKGVHYYALPVLLGCAWVTMFLVMPYNGPDEDYHYNSAFALSNVLMNQENVYEIPAPYNDLSGLNYNTNAAHSYVTITKDLLGETEDVKTTGASEALSTNTYGVRTNDFSFPEEYFLSAVGITIGRLLHLSLYKVYYLGRLFNFLGYFALVYLAIWIIPVNKELVLLAGALPSAMMQACSLSYDSLQNGAAILLFALVIRLCCLPRLLQWKDLLPVLIASCLMAPVKIIYLVMLAVVFLIPETQFATASHIIRNGRKQPFWERTPSRKSFILAAVAITLVFTLLTRIGSLIPFLQTATSSLNIAASAAQNADYSQVSIDPASALSYYTLPYVFHHLPSFLRMLLYTWLSAPLQWLSGAIGILDVNGGTSSYGLLADYSVLPLVLLLLVCGVKRQEDNDTTAIPYRMRRSDSILLLVMSVLFTLLLSATGLTWTNYGELRIAGIQGRYFTPLLLPAAWNMMRLRIGSSRAGRTWWQLSGRAGLFYWFWGIEMYVINTMIFWIVE